ncbi:MAG: ABC transporter permease [Candidatus Eremiobacterota bacterium]
MISAILIKECKASYAFVERYANMIKHYLEWELVFIIYSIVNTLTIGLIGVESGDPSKVLYLVMGAILWGYLSILFHEIGQSISWERWEGTIEYTFMAPIHRITHLLGTCIGASIYGLIRTVLIIIIVAVFFNIDLHKANISGAILILALSGLSFIGLGLMSAVLPLLSPEKGPQATHIIQAMILLVSGVYYDVSVLPPWIQPLAYLSPATYTLKAMRRAIMEGTGILELKSSIVLLIITGLITIPLGLIVFNIGEKYVKKTGKLKRNG